MITSAYISKLSAVLQRTAIQGSLFKPGRFKRFQVLMKVVFLSLLSLYIRLCWKASETASVSSLKEIGTLNSLYSCSFSLHA